ncbi:hypothetical protein HYPDE_31048 [Hyphomicrobium denitrificans 1NES1]|uniref:Uncharacterized protein n=2 Tax=Hyphomicrobium denitrificans TaxID=53399 RepID=N0B2Y3_9HYPH|nr:hypothetical protein HYPDE_31048 [Hyphomicrobium denitrificans 1NES1]
MPLTWESGMVYRVVLAFACIVHASAVTATDLRPTIDQQVHDSGICWDPDVEFPVPCDDDDGD